MRWTVQLSWAASDSLATMDPPDREAAFSVIGRLTMGPTPPYGPAPRPFAAYPGDLILPVNDRMVVGYRMPADHQIVIVDFVNVPTPAEAGRPSGVPTPPTGVAA